MASPYTQPSPPPGASSTTTAMPDPAGAPTTRPLGRRPALPGGRAVIGATLVVAAVVMTYVGYLTATAAPTQSYVVAARELRVNERVSAGDFRVVSGDLPSEVGRQVFTKPSELDGAVMLAPVNALALVTRSAALTSDRAEDAEPNFEVSFTAPRWKLAGGKLKPGERIDLVPVGDRDADRAANPVRNVGVISVEGSGKGGLSSTNEDQIVLVSAKDPTEYQAIVAVVRGDFWVVRSTNAGELAERPTPTAPPPPTTEPEVEREPPPTTAAPTTTAPPVTTATAPTTTRAPSSTRADTEPS
jgi:hypothetical protein